MIPFLYITSSSYSGSTLLSFLLNAHSRMVSVGEMEGWTNGGDSFPCSCGVPLSQCRFFLAIASAFRHAGLPFRSDDFGTRYRVVDGSLNRALTAELRGIRLSVIERLRDRLVEGVPFFAARLARQDRANRLFVEAALDAAEATVFVDASKSPYRLRHLRRIKQLDIHVVHLVRDPRGVVLSNMKKRGFDARLAIRLWIREQVTVARIASEFPKTQRVFYEDLCERIEETLSTLHRSVGLSSEPAPADLRRSAHHILGNDMRLAATTVSADARWKRELSRADLEVIAATSGAFRTSHRHHTVSDIIARYGCDQVPPPTAAGQGVPILDTPSGSGAHESAR